MTAQARGLLGWVARHDRVVVLAAAAFAAAAGLFGAAAFGDSLMRSDGPMAGTPGYAVVLFLMWWSMMMAMMLPSAVPAVLAFGAISRKMPSHGPVSVPAFIAGYAVLWTAFSLAAVLLQLTLARAVPLTDMMAVTSHWLGGILLVAAGLYQLSPLKQACLRNCQPPFFWLARNWQEGPDGALRMGLAHGTYCLGCCWVLMLLLFYGGVMDFRWIIGLALYVAVEKLVPPHLNIHRLAAAALVIWGTAVIVGAWMNP